MMIQEIIKAVQNMPKEEVERIIIKIDNEEEGITREDLIIQSVQYYLDGIDTIEELEDRIKAFSQF